VTRTCRLDGFKRASIAGLIAAASAFGLGCAMGDRLPTDARLESLYRGHERDLHELAALAIADTLLVGAGYDPILRRFSIYVRDTPQADRLLNARDVHASGRGVYQKLLDRSGLRCISRSSDGTAVRFVVASNADARKGLIYSTKLLTPVRPSVDGMSREARRFWRSFYVSLEPGWYVFLEPRPEMTRSLWCGPEAGEAVAAGVRPG
jgi:hypothetical protein